MNSDKVKSLKSLKLLKNILNKKIEKTLKSHLNYHEKKHRICHLIKIIKKIKNEIEDIELNEKCGSYPHDKLNLESEIKTNNYSTLNFNKFKPGIKVSLDCGIIVTAIIMCIIKLIINMIKYFTYSADITPACNSILPCNPSCDSESDSNLVCKPKEHCDLDSKFDSKFDSYPESNSECKPILSCNSKSLCNLKCESESDVESNAKSNAKSDAESDAESYTASYTESDDELNCNSDSEIDIFKKTILNKCKFDPKYYYISNVFSENFKNLQNKLDTKLWLYEYNTLNYRSDDGIIIQNKNGAILSSSPFHFTQFSDSMGFIQPKFAIRKPINYSLKTIGIIFNFQFSQESTNLTPIPPRYSTGIKNAGNDFRLANSGLIIQDRISGGFCGITMCYNLIYFVYGIFITTNDSDIFQCATPIITKNNSLTDKYDFQLLINLDGSIELYFNNSKGNGEIISVSNIGIPNSDLKFMDEKRINDNVNFKYAPIKIKSLEVTLGNYNKMNLMNPVVDITEDKFQVLFKDDKIMYLPKDGVNNELIECVYLDHSGLIKNVNYGQGSKSEFNKLNIYELRSKKINI